MKPLYFVPLGGSGEIGMNVNAYGYNNQWIVVDLGITFGSRLGIEVIVPDIDFLRDKKLLGLVVTHGHEDHIGAIPYIWAELRCPIFATPFTASLVRRKLRDVGLSEEAVTVIPLKGKFSLGPFDLEYITLTHSIPEPNALAIRTPQGIIFHTGDWKIDANPLIGEVTDELTLRALGEEGVLALVGDSTNALEPGWSGSEKLVRDELIGLVAQASGCIAITCFSSNVARLETCAMAAEASGRYPILVGRSLQRMYDSAKECGYLGHLKPFLSDAEFSQIDRERALLICTGSQGEARSALARIAFEQHPTVRLKGGDTVIFSSRVIPGNEKEIARLHNQLVKRDITVITPKQSDVHVSGHPCRDELKLMYEWIKPHISIPVHGEHRHMQAHAELALEAGATYAFVPENGDILQLSREGVTVEGKVNTIPAAVDGSQLVPLNDDAFKERNKVMLNGCVFISLLITRQRKLSEIKVDTLGICHPHDEFADDLADRAALAYEALLLGGGTPSLEKIEEQVRLVLRREIMNETGKKPVCVVHVYQS